jgi:release factor glutamine methyltransferase
MTAAAALVSDAAATLAAAGVPAPEWDAERLLRHVLGWDRAVLIANPDRVVPEPEAERFRALVRRRASREPLQYILGTQAFWKHDFLVTPAVLIPRPETELLVETSLELLKNVERPLIVDVGTGSGCIALSLAFERPDAEVHAIDISEAALAVARENARRLGLEGGVAFHHGDLLEPVVHLAGRRIDLVVSNPPYVDPADRPGLAPEVRDHEPPDALFPPGGTLSVYRRLATASAVSLRDGGRLALEVSPFVAGQVSELLVAAGFAAPSACPDLAGRPRVVFARRVVPPVAPVE